MKKKNIIALIFGVLFASTALPEETDFSIPRLAQLKEIDMSSARLPWIGIFRSNGAALLGYGAQDDANVPEASFQFEEIYNLLVPYLKPDFNYDVDSIGVGFFYPDTSIAKTFYLEDKEIMRKLMHGLCDKVLASPDPFMDEKRFRGLLQKHPLVPGDPPYLKADEEAGEGEVKGNKEEVVRSKEEVADNKEEVGRSKEEGVGRK